MKLLFNLEYHTTFGEDLVLNILPADDTAKVSQHKMTTLDGNHWFVEINKAVKPETYIDYYYSVLRGEEEKRHEWLVEPHRLEFAATKASCYTVYDHWIDIPDDAYMYSSAFTECVLARQRALSTKSEYPCTIRLKVRAPQLRADERLAIVGEAVLLGAWDARKAVAMTEHGCHEWVASLDASQLPQGRMEFKFVILGKDVDSPLWEQGMNRSIDVPQIEQGEVVVYELSQAFFPIYPWKGAGTVVPIFSLRSEGSFGVGDFGDLKLMIDWVAKTQQRILQVLPINDTNITHTWQDSYPYNSISIYALHPQYIDFRQMAEIKDKEKRDRFEALRQELNALSQIDYERMFSAKMDYLQELYRQEGAATKRTAAYKKFYNENKHWLEPYAEFCFYRDLYGTATFSEWPKPLAKADKKVTDFWCYVQYHLDRQMHAAHDYARQHRVVLKGDIPIGISRDGVEAWVEPKYFNLNGQAAKMAVQKPIWKWAARMPSSVLASSSIWRIITAKSIPLMPATSVSTMLSEIICERIILGVAPMARRIPISVVRSRTVTIIMFDTPMAPASSVPRPTSQMRKLTPLNRLSSNWNSTSVLKTIAPCSSVGSMV